MDPEQFEIPTEGDVDMTDDDIAASLGFATSISEGLLPQDEMMPEEEQETENAEEEMMPEEGTEETQEDVGAQILERLDAIEKKLEPTDVEKEIENIQKELDALKNEQGDED